VKVYNSSDSEAENKSTAKVKLISSIFATKNKKARELSDSGSEKEDNPSRATKVKKKKREKEKKKKREKEKMKRPKRRRESDSSEDEESSYRKPTHSPPASVDSSPVSKLTPSHKPTSSQRSTPLINSNRLKNPPNSSPQSSSSRSPLYYPEVKSQPGVAPLAPLLSPLSPGGDLKQEVESKNGISRNGMEQDNDDEEDGEVHEEEEEGAEPYCQPRHRPFPPIEELQDRKYWAKLQTINAAINDPHTGQDQLNQIVDLILETGNFSTSAESFNFDICNLENSVVQQIGEVLGI